MPSVCAAMYSAILEPALEQHVHHARARAPRRCRAGCRIHSSHCAAVRVLIGSIAMTRAPFARASSTNGQRCGLAVSVFVPHSRIRSLSGMPSGSAPMFAPTVMRMPIVPAIEQIVRSSIDAPRRWKNRRSIDEPWIMPIVPGVRIRQDGLGSVGRAANVVQPRGDLVERLVPADLLEPPGPFRAESSHGVEQPVAMIGALDVPVHLRAEKSSREGMVGIAGDAHGAATRPSRASRRCRDSRAGRPRGRFGS